MLNAKEQSTATKRVPAFDEDGFLVQGHPWSKGLSRTLAEMEGIEKLSHDHWAIIFYLREHHDSYGALPPMSQVCRTHGMDKAAIRRLFGGCRQAWRVAGLPNPGEEALNYM
jgi:TusE/DsrC/DsvC family sulfur relay protein